MENLKGTREEEKERRGRRRFTAYPLFRSNYDENLRLSSLLIIYLSNNRGTSPFEYLAKNNLIRGNQEERIDCGERKRNSIVERSTEGKEGK